MHNVYILRMCVCAKLIQSCPILCDPMDCNPPGSSVHGLLQVKIMEWIAMPSSMGWNPRLLCLLQVSSYSKMAVWGGLTYSCEKKRGQKHRRKGKIKASKCRVPKNSKKR